MVQSDTTKLIGELINARLSAGQLAEQAAKNGDLDVSFLFITMRDVLQGLERSTINYTQCLKGETKNDYQS